MLHSSYLDYKKLDSVTVRICLYDFGRWYMVCFNIDRVDVNMCMN